MIPRAVHSFGKASRRFRDHTSPGMTTQHNTNRQRLSSSRQPASESRGFPTQVQVMQQGSVQVQQRKYAYCLRVQCFVIATRPNVHVAPDPYAYSSGRWLCWDKSERESRYIPFNFSALCKRAIALCPGAKSIASYEKKEGGYNRVFIFTMDNTMDNTRRVVARLPTRLSGPPRLTVNSEVATIKYCRFSPLLCN